MLAGLGLFVLASLASTLKPRVFIVDANSMRPVLNAGDVILCTRAHVLKTTDIVVAKADLPGGALIVKRVVGVPGDAILVRGPFIAVNGRKLPGAERRAPGPDDLRHSVSAIPTAFQLQAETTTLQLLDREFFLLGDNRNSSTDSRAFGPVLREDIVCKAVAVVGTVRNDVPLLSRIMPL